MTNHRMVWGFLFLSCSICTIAAAQSAPSKKDIPAIAKAANGAIVSIVMSDNNGKPIAQGSGFFVSKDGVVVTNYHVIAEGNSAVAKLPDGTFYVVDGVLGSDKERDIAVIKAHGQNFWTLTLGNSDRIQVGEEVVAIGNPLSLESTVSNGIVSGIRTIKEEGGNLLQITAPISPGSSGGPLFNMAGEVIGITTAGLKGGENLNFAIPINDVKRLLNPSAKLQELPNERRSAVARAKTPKAPKAPGAHNETELQDTLEWMQNSIKDNSYVDTPRYGTATSVGITTGHGCWVLIVEVYLDDRSMAVTSKFTSRFNLSDIDPNTVSFQENPQGGFEFEAKTTNDAEKISFLEEYFYKEHSSGDPTLHHINLVNFELNPTYGLRFNKAFKHAVELCGGKPSKCQRSSESVFF